jgi:hypothetical protein
MFGQTVFGLKAFGQVYCVQIASYDINRILCRYTISLLYAQILIFYFVSHFEDIETCAIICLIKFAYTIFFVRCLPFAVQSFVCTCFVCICCILGSQRPSLCVSSKGKYLHEPIIICNTHREIKVKPIYQNFYGFSDNTQNTLAHKLQTNCQKISISQSLFDVQFPVFFTVSFASRDGNFLD